MPVLYDRRRHRRGRAVGRRGLLVDAGIDLAPVSRDGFPSAGPSFPSGHVILAAAVGCVVTPVLVVEWSWVPALVVSSVMVGRVYVGADNPLDVTAGLGAGLVAGGATAMFVG